MEIFSSLNQYSDIGLLALRIGVGVVFLVHGTMKWSMWKMQPSAQMSGGMLNLMRFLSIVEPLGALAIITGFLTQLAALGLGLVMISAIFMKIKMWKMPFTAMDKIGWEFDFILLAANIALFLMGAGVYALDPRVFGL